MLVAAQVMNVANSARLQEVQRAGPRALVGRGFGFLDYSLNPLNAREECDVCFLVLNQCPGIR